MSESLNSRYATLSNGDTVPLLRATHALNLLQCHLELSEEEWDVLFFLREVCLDRPIEREQQQVLQRVKVMNSDGEIDPTMKSVVLSAVRGEGRNLWLESPFTDGVDRAISNFLAAREFLAVRLSPQDYDALVTTDDPRRLDEEIRDALAPPPIPHELLDVKEFARRCREGKSPPNQDGQNR